VITVRVGLDRIVSYAAVRRSYYSRTASTTRSYFVAASTTPTTPTTTARFTARSAARRCRSPSRRTATSCESRSRRTTPSRRPASRPSSSPVRTPTSSSDPATQFPRKNNIMLCKYTCQAGMITTAPLISHKNSSGDEILNVNFFYETSYM